jgi:hypothetical protein
VSCRNGIPYIETSYLGKGLQIFLVCAKVRWTSLDNNNNNNNNTILTAKDPKGQCQYNHKQNNKQNNNINNNNNSNQIFY